MNAPRPLALVTGGAKGLGRHLCLRLAERGFDVVVNYLSSAAEAAALVAEIEARGAAGWAVQANVAEADEVAALFRAADATGRRLALVVNNVGIYNPVPLAEISSAQWERTLRTNLSGAFHVCREALVRLRREGSGGGQIVNIGVAGAQLNRAELFATDYYVSKAGLLQLTRSLAAAWADRAVRVNMVSPGQLVNSIGEVGGAPGAVPIGRDGSFEDVWNAIAYLLDAAYVTGVQIEVAGGYRL